MCPCTSTPPAVTCLLRSNGRHKCYCVPEINLLPPLSRFAWYVSRGAIVAHFLAPDAKQKIFYLVCNFCPSVNFFFSFSKPRVCRDSKCCALLFTETGLSEFQVDPKLGPWIIRWPGNFVLSVTRCFVWIQLKTFFFFNTNFIVWKFLKLVWLFYSIFAIRKNTLTKNIAG